MVEISKLYQPPYNSVSCSELLMHDGLTCKQIFRWNWYRCSVGCLKYFLPLAISPLVLRPRSLNRQTLLNILRYYLETSLWGSTSSALTIYCICLYRRLFGRYYLLTATFLPTYTAFQLSWFYPIRTVRLFGTATSQAALETWLRKQNHFITKSLPIQTIVFMLSSAVVLHFKRRKEFNGFWFIQPSHIDESQQKGVENLEDLQKSAKCVHEGTTCTKYILREMSSYLMYGIPLDLLSTVTKRKMPRSLSDLKMIRFEMTAFFLSYVGIYRLSSCLLTRYTVYGTREHLLAAGLGGLSYFFLNKLAFSVLAFVIAVQAYWQSYCSQPVEKPENKIETILKSVPFAKLLVPYNLAYLTHVFIFHNHAMSNIAKGFFRGATDNRFAQIHQYILDTLARHDKMLLS
ncbi:uncharacterized protein LOC126753696 [Bactrocera neohumeralis]|uniref:uncharacterized protein LOC126753696 n=1 Tax=Bactrocera neohumeralis TaxID=98809 RepID=UPI002165C0EF|nr:uncharacterized protein LOC126753696 [Bactrocera neohumeralis]